VSLSDYEFKASYNKADDDIAGTFYLPCMRSSVGYDRISGYYGSTIYIIAWSALKEFISNGGKMRLICSPYISDSDKEALTHGYSARNNRLLEESLRLEVEGLFSSPVLYAPALLLSYLVAEGIIDVKIAVPGKHVGADAKRLFHDKIGIFTDGDGFSVGFRGSMNETYKGLSSDGNIESVDVFPSWIDARDRERVDSAKDFFERLWINTAPGVVVYPFPEAIRDVLRTKAQGTDWEELLDEIKILESSAERWKPDKRTGTRMPRPHQVRALEDWVKNGRRGIFEHATGSGKTFTAECGIVDALHRKETVLVLVPSRNLLAQWYKEMRVTLSHMQVFFLLCGDGNNEWRRKGELARWTALGEQNRVIIATMDTASSAEFVRCVTEGAHLFIVADEVHRIGSPERRRTLQIDSGARLGLSATPRRYGDAEGTGAIFDYFGGIIPPPFTLDDAIRSDVLTRYFYHPQKLYLSQIEQEHWNAITDEIKKHLARTSQNNRSGSVIMLDMKTQRQVDQRLKQLLINRSRIVKNAEDKVKLAADVFREHYRDGQKWIVYCDNIGQMRAAINAVAAVGLDVIEYYAEMEGDRAATLRYFESNGGVLVSIKCLDEGVDIPSITHALILASSQNPREFIQRRGRILRKSKNKHFAHLYDAITMPVAGVDEGDRSLSIISSEIARAIRFGQGAENKDSCVTDLKLIAIDFHIDTSAIGEGGVEDDDIE
jgi:superfamily II DNA or RNA helicase